VKWLCAAALCVLSAPASALAIGDKTCADAEVVANIKSQVWESLSIPDPHAIVTDGLVHLTLRVEKVIYGPIVRGPLAVIAVAPNYLNSSVKLFFLQTTNRREWRIASCGR
jgi:hypothetical protein